MTVIRLRKSGAMVDDEVLEALKITLRPPSSPAQASPELIDQVRSHISQEVEIKQRKEHIEYTRSHTTSPLVEGIWNCNFLLQNYESMNVRSDNGGYWIYE